MSLRSPRLIAPMVALALGAVTITSCSQQPSPTSPSANGMSAAVQPAAEYWITLFDETPPDAPPDAPAADEAEPPPPPAPGSAPSPWPPGPPPRALPGVPVPKPPSTHPRVRIRINPEPVPHSGVPTGTCQGLPYTWYYDQELITETGVPVVFDERHNFFDGRFSSKNTTRVAIAGNNNAVVHTRWCSAIPIPHYTQTRWIGKDDYNNSVEIDGPWVRLLAP
jgi:hypothetical protein